MHLSATDKIFGLFSISRRNRAAEISLCDEETDISQTFSIFPCRGEWKNLNLHISIYPCSVEKEIFSTFFYFSISLKNRSVGWPEGTLTNLILTYVHPQCSHLGSVAAVHVSLVGEQPLQYLHGMSDAI